MRSLEPKHFIGNKLIILAVQLFSPAAMGQIYYDIDTIADEGEEWGLRLDESLAVWFINEEDSSVLYYRDMDDDSPSTDTIEHENGTINHTSLDGDRGEVAFSSPSPNDDDTHLFYWDIEAGEIVQITEHLTQNGNPVIDRGWIAWDSKNLDDDDENREIFIYEIGGDGGNNNISNNDYYNDVKPIMDDRQIVWTANPTDETSRQSEIFFYDIDSETITQITIDNDSAEEPIIDSAPDIHEGRIVWVRNDPEEGSVNQVFYLDTNESLTQIHQLSDDDEFFAKDPQIYGNIVTWHAAEHFDDPENPNFEIFFFNLDRLDESGYGPERITDDDYVNSPPQIHDGYIIWNRMDILPDYGYPDQYLILSQYDIFSFFYRDGDPVGKPTQVSFDQDAFSEIDLPRISRGNIAWITGPVDTPGEREVKYGMAYPDGNCNGDDDDGDGLVDNQRGGCALRLLIVPFCWEDATQEEFEEAADDQVEFLLTKSGLNSCAEDYFFMIGDINDLNIPCQYEPEPYFAEGQVSHAALQEHIESYYDSTGDKSYDLRNYDGFVAITNVDYADEAKGAVYDWGDPRIWIESQHEESEFFMAHEFGHGFLHLHDEYCSQEGGAGGNEDCNSDDSPNPLSGDHDCDPADPECCNLSFRNTDPEVVYLNDSICGGVANKCCLGNKALDIPENWDPSMGTPPQSDEGRCIMSCSDCSPVGTRGWCAECWEEWEERGWSCGQVYDGSTRMLIAVGRVDELGQTALDRVSIGESRGGYAHDREGGRFIVEILDNFGNVLESGSVYRQPLGIDGRGLGNDVGHFWIRTPIGDRPSDTEFTVRASNLQGEVLSEVTINGAAPTADAGPDATAFCGQLTTLDGTGSSDPDGDTLTFSWTGEGDVWFDDPTSAVPTVTAPVGTYTITLEVSDGLYTATGTVALSIVDMTGPAITCPADTVLECPGDTSVEANGEAVAADGCDAENVTISHSDSETDGCGETTAIVRQWSAEDLAGNVSTCGQTITVEDTTPPEMALLGPEGPILECNVQEYVESGATG